MDSSALALLASADETRHGFDALVVFLSLKDNMIIELMQPLLFANQVPAGGVLSELILLPRPQSCSNSESNIGSKIA